MSAREVLIVGGSGVVGSRAVRALRQLHPRLRIAIAARDLARADALARELGEARALAIDLTRSDLGLPAEAAFAAIVMLLPDDTLHALRFAQQRGTPYVAFSQFAFELAPAIAQYVQHAERTVLLNLSSTLGGMVATVTREYARALHRVDAVRIGLLLDEDDVGGPTARGDFERIAQVVPRPLLRVNGAFAWAAQDAAQRTFVDGRGERWTGHAVALLDVTTLSAVTGARDVRVDIAVRPRARRAESAGPSTQVVVEIDGEGADGSTQNLRFSMLDGDVHARLSARGVALGIERLLGLDGQAAVVPGLHYAETLLDPARTVARLRELGTMIERI